jgi:hypothetical protein
LLLLIDFLLWLLLDIFFVCLNVCFQGLLCFLWENCVEVGSTLLLCSCCFVTRLDSLLFIFKRWNCKKSFTTRSGGEKVESKLAEVALTKIIALEAQAADWKAKLRDCEIEAWGAEETRARIAEDTTTTAMQFLWEREENIKGNDSSSAQITKSALFKA